MKRIITQLVVLLIVSTLSSVKIFSQNYLPLVPDSLRGAADAEREGTHDANNIRTLFYNFGMVGDYPPDPLNVDVTVFHSIEVPKGSGIHLMY